MSRPTHNDKDVFAQKPGFFSWLRDKAYDFVYNEGDFVLQFTADLIRGEDPVRENRHIQRQMNYREQKTNSEKRLSNKEYAVFLDLLKRNLGEDQVAYWKRKKACLLSNNKQGLVKRHSKNMNDKQKQAIKVEASNVKMPTRNKQKSPTRTKTRKR